MKKSYRDRDQVVRKVIYVSGNAVEFVEAGDSSRVVVFCHGAAFSMRTWQYVGILDALAARGYRAIAINLPGYGATSRTISGDRDGFLESLLDALQIARVVVVAASMGGSYGLPFLYTSSRAAGYITVAGVLGKERRQRKTLSLPVLAIYGSRDPRLQSDSQILSTLFSRHELVVIPDAPHPCYLRDRDAAEQFTELVVSFVERVQTL